MSEKTVAAVSRLPHEAWAGFDELIDAAIIAGARRVYVVLHVSGGLIGQVHFHDTGKPRARADIERVLQASDSTPEEGFAHALHRAVGVGTPRVSVLTAAAEGEPELLTLSESDNQPRSGESEERELLWDWRRQACDDAPGTTVVWHGLYGSYHGTDADQAQRYFDGLIEELLEHLALRYHQRLRGRRNLITLLVQGEDGAVQEYTLPEIDPFAQPHPRVRNYPMELTIDGEPGAPSVIVHICDPASRPDDSLPQGFYFYVKNRLIEYGTWFNYCDPASELRLARVEINDPRVLQDYFRLRPGPCPVGVTPQFHEFLDSLRAVFDRKHTFATFLRDARAAAPKDIPPQDLAPKDTSRQDPPPQVEQPVVAPAPDLAEMLRNAFDEITELLAAESINVLWTTALPAGKLADLDQSTNTIRVNEELRTVLGSAEQDNPDSPLLHTLTNLLRQDILARQATAPAEAETHVHFHFDINVGVATESTGLIDAPIAEPQRVSAVEPEPEPELASEPVVESVPEPEPEPESAPELDPVFVPVAEPEPAPKKKEPSRRTRTRHDSDRGGESFAEMMARLRG